MSSVEKGSYWAEHMAELAKPFYDVNSMKQEGDKLVFAKPWLISVQSLGGTVFSPSIQPFLVLYLHIKDEPHLAQRNYADCQERALQSALFLDPWVKQRKMRVFIKSVLGPSDKETVYPHPFMGNLLWLLDVCFEIHGARFHIEQDVLCFQWDLQIHLINAQPAVDYFAKQYKPIQGQTVDPTVLMQTQASAAAQGSAPSPDPSVAALRSPAPDASKPTSQPSPSPSPHQDPTPMQLECPVCFETVTKLVALVPCGHATYCWDCAEHLDACAVCRAPIQLRLKLYQ